jgi:hypothetical protein
MRFILLLFAAIVAALAADEVPAPVSSTDKDAVLPKFDATAAKKVTMSPLAALSAMRGLAIRREKAGRDTTEVNARIAKLEELHGPEIVEARQRNAARKAAKAAKAAQRTLSDEPAPEERKRYPVNLDAPGALPTSDAPKGFHLQQGPNPWGTYPDEYHGWVNYTTCCKDGPPDYFDHPGLYQEPAMMVFPYCRLGPIVLSFMWLMGYQHLDSGLWCAPACEEADEEIDYDQRPPTTECPQPPISFLNAVAPAWCAFRHVGQLDTYLYCGVVCMVDEDCGYYNEAGTCTPLAEGAYYNVYPGVCSFKWDYMIENP